MILTFLVCNRTTWRSQFWSSRSRIVPKNLHSYKLQVTLTLLAHDSHSGEHHSEGLQSLQSMAISPELTSVLCHRQTYCEVDEVDCQALTPMAPSRTYLVVWSGWRYFGEIGIGHPFDWSRGVYFCDSQSLLCAGGSGAGVASGMVLPPILLMHQHWPDGSCLTVCP